MLDFHPAALEEREWVTNRMRCTGWMGSDYTFANLYNWADVYQICIARMDDYLIIRSGEGPFGYLFPAGEGDVRPVIDAIAEDSARQGHDLLLYNLPRQATEILESLWPGRFFFKEERNNFDYIYTQESLATLAGKKLHGKRNHIARFKDNHPDWSYEPLSLQNLDEAWEMNREWCRQNDCPNSHSLQKEACAVKRAFENFEAEQLVGGLLRAEGRVIAYTMGSPVRDDTFVVHIEKAFADIQGAYPMINQQFVANSLKSYTYINREDDVGDLGLRKAKLSYYPAMLYERFEAFEKEKA